jgi:hypothetical protein
MAKADGDIVWFDGVQVNQGESAFAFADKPIPGTWISYTPTVTVQTGSFTAAATGRYCRIGKLVFWTALISISDTGSASGVIRITNPIPCFSAFAYIGAAKEINVTGKNGVANTDSNYTSINDYNNSYIGGTGYAVYASGFYEAA